MKEVEQCLTVNISVRHEIKYAKYFYGKQTGLLEGVGIYGVGDFGLFLECVSYN